MDQELLAVCRHEAGHCVGARLIGFTVNWVKFAKQSSGPCPWAALFEVAGFVSPEGWAAMVSREFPARPADMPNLVGFAFVHQSGPAADVLYGRGEWAGWFGDTQTTAAYLSYVPEAMGLTAEKLRDLAAWHLENHRDAIERLAYTLAANHERGLDKEQIDAALVGVPVDETILAELGVPYAIES